MRIKIMSRSIPRKNAFLQRENEIFFPLLFFPCVFFLSLLFPFVSFTYGGYPVWKGLIFFNNRILKPPTWSLDQHLLKRDQRISGWREYCTCPPEHYVAYNGRKKNCVWWTPLLMQCNTCKYICIHRPYHLTSQLRLCQKDFDRPS